MIPLSRLREMRERSDKALGRQNGVTIVRPYPPTCVEIVRTDLPALLDEVERLRGLVVRMGEAIYDVSDEWPYDEVAEIRDDKKRKEVGR